MGFLMIRLLPYQLEGIAYALERKGTIIADEMGLGKTVQAIGVINADTTIHKVLIICPKSLKLNWQREIERWRQREDVSITIVSYSELRKVTPVPLDLLIVDEAQYIKTPDAKRTKEVHAIRKNARKVLALTGTPFENRVYEIWSLLQLVDPEYWDPQKTEVRKDFLKPLPSAVVLRSSKPKPERSASDRNLFQFKMRYCGPVKRQFAKRGQIRTAWEFKGGSNLAELNLRLRESCMIRRLKRDVLTELPEKRRQIVAFPTKYAEDVHAPLLVAHSEITVANYDDIVYKLRSNKVAFEEWSRYRHMQGVEKVPLVAEHVERLLEEKQKVIVFVHHMDVADSLKLVIPHSVMVTGDTPESERMKAVDRFQNDPSTRVFIGSIRAAGVGFTLTAASTVVFAEIDPNPATMRQAEDRAHRIGQRDMVLVQYLVSDGSIDARLCQILADKLDLWTAALDR